MEDIHADLPVKNFPSTDGIVQARICTKSGKLATTTCEHDQVVLLFNTNILPKEPNLKNTVTFIQLKSMYYIRTSC